MVETITPVVHGGRRSRYLKAVGLHVAGAGLSAAAVGFGLGALGLAARAPWGAAGLGAVAAVALCYALRATLGVPVPIPDRRRQVPVWWRTYFSPDVAAFLYGAGLGVGFLTFLSFGTYVAVATSALISGRPLLGAALCAPFGIARGATVLLTRGTATGDDAARVADRVEDVAATPVPRAVNAAALVALAAAALVAL